MYGLDLIEDLDSLRKIIGICNQRDVLYDQLSFEESLEFMGKIKGLSGQKLQQEIEYVIQKTRTESHRKKLVCQLSGGNKRKLSLGQALIGGSKVIFLDEPTSGMDTISRRKIWEILETLKQE